jgi:hypothetical protein
MDENKNHINKRLSEQLPSHSPDAGTWQRLSSELDAINAEAVYQEKLQGLPVHSPDQGTWNVISGRLTRIAYYKTGVRIALSVAAGLLLFFTVSRVSETYQTKNRNNIPQLANQEQFANPSAAIIPANPAKKQASETLKITGKTGIEPAGIKIVSNSTAIHEDVKAKTDSESSLPDNNIIENTVGNQGLLPVEAESATTALNSGNVVSNGIPVQPGNNTEPVAQSNTIQIEPSLTEDAIKTDLETKSILFQKEPYTTTASTSIKQYSPPVPLPSGNRNHVALDMNYLPENIYNGTDNSLFHNVDLTASYNKEKVRFNTSLGMAYNEEQLEFDMSYDINTPVTAMGPGGKVDTLSYNVANMESEYMGTEKHKYVTYNLGFGRRIFSSGKFSTWFNAGAGFGVQLSNPDLILATTNSVKNQYNAQVVSVKSSTPVYNDVNVNFVTAIDFNYRIISKLSITFTPTSRWYFKPVLSLNNQATDELTLGFRTGLKFEF